MRIVDLLIVLVTVLQVKDTGKSRERVKPVELDVFMENVVALEISMDNEVKAPPRFYP